MKTLGHRFLNNAITRNKTHFKNNNNKNSASSGIKYSLMAFGKSIKLNLKHKILHSSCWFSIICIAWMHKRSIFLQPLLNSLPQPDVLPPLPASSCCILCGEAGTRLLELSCTHVFDWSAEVSWVFYMCGVDHLLPFSVYWTVKPGGHRPTWLTEAPRSHQKGTHFMKNNTNNVTRAEYISFPAALQIRFLLYYSSHYTIGHGNAS